MKVTPYTYEWHGKKVTPKGFGYELLRSPEPIHPKRVKEFMPELFI